MCLALGYMLINTSTTGAGHVRFSFKTDHIIRLNCIPNMKHFYVETINMGTEWKVEVTFYTFNGVWINIDGNYIQKQTTSL